MTSDWRRNGLIAGLVGAFSFAIFAVAATGYLGQGHAFGLNQIAAVVPVLRPAVHRFVPMTLLGLGLDLAVGTFWGLLYALVVERLAPRLARSPWGSTVLGVVLGAFAWVVSGLWIGLRLDAALRLTNPLDYYFAHFIYGMIAAWTFAVLARRRRLSVSMLSAERAQRANTLGR